jgi:transcriptional regulator with XRE-family HTH domain
MDAIELKILRIKARLRQYEVAARLGITQTKLSEIECGRIQPSPELLERNLGALEGELRAKVGVSAPLLTRARPLGAILPDGRFGAYPWCSKKSRRTLSLVPRRGRHLVKLLLHIQ